MNAMYTRIWKNPRNEKNRDKERLQVRKEGREGREGGREEGRGYLFSSNYMYHSHLSN
jgi:hypothetical protein